MTTSTDTLMTDLRGTSLDGHDLTGGDDFRFTVHVGDDDGRATLAFTEPLGFHADYAGPDEWSAVTDADGWLTHAAETILADRLRDYLAAELGEAPEYIGAVDSGGDEPVLELEVAADYRPGETFGQWFDRIGWPVVASIINTTDPGTFGAPYWFASLAEDVAALPTCPSCDAPHDSAQCRAVAALCDCCAAIEAAESAEGAK